MFGRSRTKKQMHGTGIYAPELRWFDRWKLRRAARQDARKGIPAVPPPPQPARIEQLIDQFTAAALDREARFRQDCEGLLVRIRVAAGQTAPPNPAPGGSREARLAADAYDAHAARQRNAEMALDQLVGLVDECKADLNWIDSRYQLSAEEYRGEVVRRHHDGATLSLTWEVPSLLDRTRDRIPWLGMESKQIAEAIANLGVQDRLSWSDYPVAGHPAASADPAPSADPASEE